MENRTGEFKKNFDNKKKGMEIQKFYHMNLDPDVANFRCNVLFVIKVMMDICKTLATMQCDYIYNKKKHSTESSSI